MKSTKLALSVLLGISLILFGQLFLFFSAPADASPVNQFVAPTQFWSFLDTAGNGTGTTVATGTYTSTVFYLQPAAANVYAVDRLIVSIEDSQVITPTLYGSATITNGIAIRRVSGSQVITFTDSIDSNIAWRRFCEVQQTNLTGVTNQLQAICSFAVPVQLNGDRNERLEVLLQDDFSGLDGHYFVAQGYKQ